MASRWRQERPDAVKTADNFPTGLGPPSQVTGSAGIVRVVTGRGRWSVVVAFAMVAAATQLLWLTFAPITTQTAVHYGVSKAAVGWLAQVFPLLYVVLAIPAGIALDRNFRGALLAGAALSAIGAIVRLGDSFTLALIGQLLVATAQPFVLNSIAKLAHVYLPESERAQGIVVGSIGTFMGMLLGLLLGPIVATSRSFGALLTICAIFAVVAAIALAICLRLATVADDAAQPSATIGRAELRAMWQDRTLRTLAWLAFAGFGLFVALATWLQTLLSPRGVSDHQASALLAAMVIAGVISCAFLPTMVARRGQEALLLRAVVFVAGVGCVLVALFEPLPVAWIALVPTGALLLTALPVILELTERRAGDAGGIATAIIWLAGNAGGLVVAGLLSPLVNDPLPAFLLLAVVPAVALPLTFGLRRLETEPAPAT